MTLWRGNEITSTLQTLISLDNLHCHNESDDIGSDEPYLWTAFFKIDGDTVILDRAADGRLVLDGTCTFVGTSGSHGNLGHTDVEEGDDVPIPAVLGEFGFSLTPIHATARTGLPPEYTVGGVVGAVVLLMEHESLTDDGAEAGHVTLNKALERGLNELIPTFGSDKQVPTAADVAALTTKVKAAVEDAATDAQGFWRNILSYSTATP